MLVIYIRDVDLLRPSQGGWAPIIFLLLLIFCEIAPVIILMDYSFMTIFEFDGAATRTMPSLPLSNNRLEIDQEVGDEAYMSAARDPLLSELS
jgi:hypothetical protein